MHPSIGPALAGLKNSITLVTMTKNLRFLFVCALAIGSTLSSAACTTEEIFYSTQHWQRQECRKLRGGDDRFRCENRPTLSFEEYQEHREKQAAK